jgi:hypothetical protein
MKDFNPIGSISAIYVAIQFPQGQHGNLGVMTYVITGKGPTWGAN